MFESAQKISGFSGMLRMNHPFFRQTRGVPIMLFTIAIVLAVLWMLGFVSGTTMGGLVHILLVLAVIMIAFQLLSGRRVG